MENSLEHIQSLIDKNELEEAEIKLRELLERDQDNLDTKITLARVLVINGKSDESQDLLKKIIEQDPKNHYPLYLLGFIKEDREEFDEAIDLYKQALKLKPNSGQINYRIGKIYKEYKYKGRDEFSALYHLRNSLTGDNPPTYAYIELASLEPLSRSIYILQNGVEKFPTDEILIATLCERLIQLGEYETCIQHIDAAKEKNVSSSSLQYLKALAQYKLQQYEQAVDSAEQIQNLDTNQNIQFQVFKSVLLCESHRYSDAEMILRTAIANDIRDSLSFAGHLILICCYLRQSRYEDANKVLKEIPLDTRFESSLYLFVVGFIGVFEIEAYFLEATTGIISSNTADIYRAKYIKAVYDYSSQEAKGKLSSNRLYEIKKELVNSISLMGRDANDVYDLLYQVSMDLKDWIDSAHYYFLNQMHNEEEEVYTELKPVLEQISKSQKNLEKLFSIIEKVLRDVRYFQSRFSKKCLPQLISFFHHNQNFELVVRLASFWCKRHI